MEQQFLNTPAIRIHRRSYIKTRLPSLTSKTLIPDCPTRLSGLARPETCCTSETNQRAPPEHVVSVAVTSTTCARTFPHGNLTGTCHSVQVLSDSKVKHTSQCYHEPLNRTFATLPPPPAQTCFKQGANALTPNYLTGKPPAIRQPKRSYLTTPPPPLNNS